VLGKNVKGKDETMQYIPILNTLNALLKHEDVLAEVVNGHISSDDIIRDFCDASNFRNCQLFQEEEMALQIQLYNDDITVANPLGNKVKNLKLSAFYFVLGNIDPKFRSKLCTVQLVALCPALLMKKYSIGEVLKPLIHDLKKLEVEGIKILNNEREPIFRGTVYFVSADNLAAHCEGGFN